MTGDGNNQAPRVHDPAHPVRVLVVDDSLTQRHMLISLLDADPSVKVIGAASGGAEAVRLAAHLKPDLITMDLRMPAMDGLEATRRIMRETPTPIVMVSADASPRNQQLAFEALQAGVLAVLPKPLPGPDHAALAHELLRTVKSMAQVRVIRRWSTPRARPDGGVTPPAPSGEASALAAMRLRRPARPPDVVAIGASTGGPQVLHEILTHLPATFTLPVLIVQHIASGFAAGLVDWLRPQCALPVSLATQGASLRHAGIVIAPTGEHLVVRGQKLWLTDDPPVSGHRPSATVLFQSVAREYGSAAIGVLLSGMGDDGAVGMRDLKRAGAVTVAQDEASSVVFGMPGVAIRLGVVDHILSPAAVAPLLVELAQRGREG